MPEHSIFAIILAAGESRRFGSTKQLAEYEGGPLVERAVRLAEAICGEQSVLVAGNDWQKVLAACEPQRGFLVCNEAYASGIAASIACGVRSIAHVADAVLILMADQPLVTAAHLDGMVGQWRNAPNDIVVSEYSGVQGPPAIFPAQRFDSLMKLEGDQGARALLKDSGYSVSSIPFEPGAVDIDTPEDLHRVMES